MKRPVNRSKKLTARIGDVIVIETSKGRAFAQYSHKNALYGQLLRILPGFHRQPPDLHELAQRPECYFVFFPLNAALREGIVEIVGNAPVPESAAAFPEMRMAGDRDPSGRVKDWWLWDGTDSSRIEGDLSEEQRRLSIAGILNDTLLIQRLEEGWRPGDEA